jgi:hypothetical protein
MSTTHEPGAGGNPAPLARLAAALRQGVPAHRGAAYLALGAALGGALALAAGALIAAGEWANDSGRTHGSSCP